MSLTVSAEREGVSFETRWYMTPNDADRLAELLEEFAEKARQGEAWVHP